MSTRPDNNKGPRVNNQITSKEIRLIDENGEMVGVVSIQEGLRMAKDAGLDLIEISPNAEPPVCKIFDLGKYRYEMQKKEAAAKKKQKVIETKELKLRPYIEDHDLQVKIRKAREFIEEGDKVRFSMVFRGRENEHREIGMAVIKQAQEALTDIAKAEMGPKFEGNQVILIMVTSSSGS